MITQDTLARDHVSMQDTLAREHVSTQGTLARENISTQGTLEREHERTQGTLNMDMYARKARCHVSTFLTGMARNLADPIFNCLISNSNV